MTNRYWVFLAFTLIVFLVLAATNPLAQEMQVQRFSRSYWVLVYGGMTLLVSLVAFVVAPALTIPLRRWGSIAAGFGSAVMTMALLGVYAYWVGTQLTAQQADGLVLRDLNHFFRNHRSVVFMFVEVPIFGLLSGIFGYLWHRAARA